MGMGGCLLILLLISMYLGLMGGNQAHHCPWDTHKSYLVFSFKTYI